MSDKRISVAFPPVVIIWRQRGILDRSSSRSTVSMTFKNLSDALPFSRTALTTEGHEAIPLTDKKDFIFSASKAFSPSLRK